MKVTIELDTNASQQDMRFFSLLSAALTIASAPSSCEACEAKAETEEKVETLVEDKPKAKRTPRKAKEEATPAPEVKVEQPVEEEVDAPAEDLSPKALVEPEVPETPAEATPEEKAGLETITPEKWREIFADKRKELGIMPGSDYENFSPMFNDLVHKISETYGNRVPSKLSEEALTRFVHNDFKFIAWNADHTGFELSKVPF